MTFAWSKNKKGAALVYAIMVLLLLATVIVALTALSNASYTDAVLAVSDDQSYYYAKSIGLAVKEQFKDGYNIARILASLDEQEADSSIKDPKVTGTFNIANDTGALVNGTIQIRYALDSDGNPNKHMIEVRSACVVNNSAAAVTSIFSCEDDSADEINHLQDALTDYDVILTDTNNLNFNFAQASEGGSGSSNLSIYVYAGEDDNVINPIFNLYLNVAGKLTTTGKTAIYSQSGAHRITGNMTSYGDLTLVNTSVDGGNGIHVDGDLAMSGWSFVKNNIYARGSVTINSPGIDLHSSYIEPTLNGAGGVLEVNTSGEHSAKNIYAQSDVKIFERAFVAGSIYTHGNVTIVGKGANPCGLYNAGDHISNTYVSGSIYSEGNVKISKGAVVKGGVYANGDVEIQEGAIVCGNVQSLTGNVKVKGAGVGGQVNCPKGTLFLDNTGYQNACAYIIEIFPDYYVFGGIGIFQYDSIYKHTCDKLSTADCEQMSIIRGNIYVENATYSSNNGTPFLSVWAFNSVYLKNSTARFSLENGSRAYSGRNAPGNAYTYITELNQKRDFYDTEANPYINMHGAHIITANIGSSKTALYDAYMWNGWIRYVNARCLYLADMMIDDYAYIFALQFARVWGTATDFTAYPSYTCGPDGGYTHARSGSVGYTVIPTTAGIEVACRMLSYDGVFGEDLRCGFEQLQNSDVRGAINVGSEASDPEDSYVVLGVSGTSETTRFYGTMHAYVGNFKIASPTRLSNVKSGTATQAATIYAEVTGGGNLYYDNDSVRPAAAKNSFYVEATNSAGEYRWGSHIQVKGNAYVAGWVYDFDHFVKDDGTGSFFNTSTARFKGAFRTTGTQVNLQGTECFTGEVQATNATSVATLKGNLTVSALRLNGSLKFDNASYVLRVHGDMYVRNVSSQIISPVYVDGNLTIQTTNQTVLKPQKAFEVGGDLYLGKNSIEFSSASQKITGKVETLNGDITVGGGAQIGGAKTASGKALTINGGTMTGSFVAGNFTMNGGTVAHATDRIYGKVTGKYVHTGGTINRAGIIVNYSSSTEAAVNISGTAQGDSVFINADNGFATVSGGSSVSYRTGILRTYYSSTIAGGFEMGINVTHGNLQIGSISTTADSYKVGTVLQELFDTEDDSYRGIYASGTLDWGYGARAPYDSPQRYVRLTRVTAGGNITFGRNDYYVPGRFDMIASQNGNINAYVQMVDGMYAKSTSWVHVSKFLGSGGDEESGIKVVSGDAYIYGKTGIQGSNGEYLRGHNEVSGNFKIMTRINTEDVRIKCKDIEGLDKIYDVSGCKPVSLYLTAPTFDSDGYYNLQYSIGGAFSVEGNLKYNDPVTIKGEIYVNGLLKRNGSFENLECNAGLYCKNEDVNITSSFRGNVHLPNATTLTLSTDLGGTAQFGLNAPKVTDFNLNLDMEGSLNLGSCNNLTVASGRTVTGSIIIKNTGKVINNGTIGESVQCGVYEGTGTVGGNLVALNSGNTSKITGAGKVTGNIWTNGSLEMDSTATSGKSGSYIYAAKNITIKNASFNTSMDYILSTGGDIFLKDCGTLPKIWNMKGGIKFENSSSRRATIASVLSYGTYIYLGTSTSTNYQTVNGDIEWYGSYSSGYAVDMWGGKNVTIIKGHLKLDGTGKVHTSDAKIEGIVYARNAGTFNSSSNGSIFGLQINSSTETDVTTVSCDAPVVDDVIVYGNSSTTTVTLASIGGFLHVHSGKTITVNGSVGGAVKVTGVKDVVMKGAIGGAVTVSGGNFTTENNATIGSNIRAYNANLYINANVSGAVTHTASASGKTVALGNQKKVITVGGTISVHGKLVDNSKQTPSNSQIYCLGTYYADLKKSFANCKMLNFTTEADGPCVIVGGYDGDWTIDTEMNIVGRFAVYTVWNESTNTYNKVTFTKQVKAHALIVNSKPAEALGYSDGLLRAAPESKVIRYSKNENSSKAQGLDKRAWMEDLVTCSATWVDIYYDALTNVATSQELVIFKKPVYISLNGNYGFKGTVHASNTKFAAGSTLYSDGQVSMKYCCLYSKGYASSTKHCTVPASPNGTYVTFLQQGGAHFDFDGSMFVHCYQPDGDNYFSHVTTNSNIGIYNGKNYILDDSEFKGCTVTDTSGYYGHTATVLMFFGASTFFDGGAHVLSAADLNKDIPAARTIVWVNSGTLFVGTNSYIGNNSRKEQGPNYANLDTNRYSFHPGVFVSQQTTSGSVSYKAANGTTYNCEYGSIEVVGSVTLDIMAYRAINIWKGGAVTAKEYSSNKDKRYKAGIYCSTGYVWLQKSDGTWQNADDSNPSGGGWFGLFAASSGGRDYYLKNDGSQVTDATAYIPNGQGYSNQLGRRYTSTADANAWCYTPWPDAPLAFYGDDANRYPTGGAGTSQMNNMTNASGVGVSDTNPTWTATGRKDAPARPTISTSGGSTINTNGDASVNPLVVNNVVTPAQAYSGAVTPKPVSTTKAESASSGLLFAGGKASSNTGYWTSPNYNVSGGSMTHPSSKWTSDVTRHFDKTQTAYWNTRFVPYNWKLPYYDSAGNSTYAKRVLTQSESVELNGHMMLKQTSSTGYFTNQSQYTGSSLADKAGSLFGWRSDGVSNNQALKDFVVLNGYPEWDGPFDKDPDHKRRTKILVFESGELPYSAFFMGAGTGSEDYASWYGNSANKSIRGAKQKAWRLGDEEVSFYDGSLVFYACKDPSDPYKANNEKDLHVVLPQGIGFDFVVDAENTVTVVGNGRVFLYLTSGDTVRFTAKATGDVYANPVGGLKDNGNGTYSPLLYIIGAGTNIDLWIDRMPISAFIYMPFGSTDALYNAGNGTLKAYNNFKSLANGATFSSLYSGTGATTAVARNCLHLLWDNTSGGARNICGTIVTDQFIYEASANNLNFKNFSGSTRKIVPDFSDTTIYSASTKSSSTTRVGSYKKYPLATFLSTAPNYSTSLLNWEYKGIKVE